MKLNVNFLLTVGLMLFGSILSLAVSRVSSTNENLDTQVNIDKGDKKLVCFKLNKDSANIEDVVANMSRPFEVQLDDKTLHLFMNMPGQLGQLNDKIKAFDFLDSTFRDLDGYLDNLNSNIDSLDQQLDVLDSAIDMLNLQLDNLNFKKRRRLRRFFQINKGNIGKTITINSDWFRVINVDKDIKDANISNKLKIIDEPFKITHKDSDEKKYYKNRLYCTYTRK